MRPVPFALWTASIPSRRAAMVDLVDGSLRFRPRSGRWLSSRAAEARRARTLTIMQREWAALSPAAQETAVVLGKSWAGTWEELLGTAAALESDD